MLNLERAAHEAMIRCSDDYQRISGRWLWRAPEYLLTTYLFQGLAGKPLASCVRPENGIEDFIREAGIRGTGVAPKAWRYKGRADLTFWDRHENPTGLIEVKCPVYAYSMVEEDHQRVESIFRRYAETSSIRFCGLAFYIASEDGVRKSSPERILGSINTIRKKFGCDHAARTRNCHSGSNNYPLKRYKNTVKDTTFSYVLTDVRAQISSWATCLVLWHR